MLRPPARQAKSEPLGFWLQGICKSSQAIEDGVLVLEDRVLVLEDRLSKASGQIRPSPTCFISQVLLKHSPARCSRSVSVCYHTAMAELSGCDREPKMYIWPLEKQSVSPCAKITPYCR